MTTVKRIEDLEVWKLARELNKCAFSYFEKIKLSHDYKLMNQMSGSCGSIMDNIAEGFGRCGNREFIQFLYIAKASGIEYKSQLYRASDRNYISKDDFNQAYQLTNKVCYKISKLISYLHESDTERPKYKDK